MIRLLLEAIKEWVEEVLTSFHAMYLGYVTPQMYGAKADGVTNDTTAVQSAINSGKPVYFPKGHYRVNNVSIPSNSKLYGQSNLSILEIINPATNSTVLRIGNIQVLGNTNIIISNLVLRGSETFGDDKSGVSLLDIWGGVNVDIQNVIFQNNMYGASRLINGCKNIHYTNCRFEACDIGIMSIGSIVSNDVTVRNCFFTSLSSFNSFTNVHSEQISIYSNVTAGITRGWVVEDCIFEYKKTNAICLHEKLTTEDLAQLGDDKTLVKDCTFRNITVRGCVGAITMQCSKNITIDGLHIESTDLPSNIEQYAMVRAIAIWNYCDAVVVNNVTIDREDLSVAVKLDTESTNCILSNIFMVSSAENPTILSGSNHHISNWIIKAVGTKNTKVNMQSLTNSYVNIANSLASTKNVIYFIKTGVSNNRFILNSHLRNTINRDNSGSDHTIVADSNIYTLTAKYIHSTSSLAQINREYVPTEVRVVMTSVDQWTANSTTNKNYYLLEDGHEFALRFAWYNNAISKDRDFSFPTDGNIIPINEPFRLSTDYDVVCHFKQINGKWVETKRVLEYKNGESEDATLSDIDFAALLGGVITND